MKINLPDNYSKLEDTLTTADKILTKAVDDSKTLFHTMVVSSFDGEKISSRVMVLRDFNLEERKKDNYKWNIKHQNRSFFKLDDQSFIRNTSLFIRNCDVWKLEDLVTSNIQDEEKKIALSLNFPEKYKHRNLLIDFIINHNEFPFTIIDNNKNILNDKSKKIVNFKV